MPDDTPASDSPALTDLAAAQDAVVACDEQAAAATELRDAYLVRAARAGENTAELSRVTGLSEVEVRRRVKAAQQRG